MKIISVSIIVVTVLVCFGCRATSSSIRHQHHRHREHLNICEACQQMLGETINRTLEELQHARECIETHGNYDIIVPTIRSTTQEELALKVTESVQELNVLVDAWSRHFRNDNIVCIHESLTKHFIRILCILKSTNAEHDCNLSHRFPRPTNLSSTIDASANFIIRVTATLNGFMLYTHFSNTIVATIVS